MRCGSSHERGHGAAIWIITLIRRGRNGSSRYGATAVAEAARPALGDAGFTAVTIAALLATSSSVNATLYASKGFTGTLAQVG